MTRSEWFWIPSATKKGRKKSVGKVGPQLKKLSGSAHVIKGVFFCEDHISVHLIVQYGTTVCLAAFSYMLDLGVDKALISKRNISSTHNKSWSRLMEQ